MPLNDWRLISDQLKKKSTSSLKDWNHFIRPNLWGYGLAVYLIGILSGGFYYSSGLLVGAIVAILLCTASITVNHYFDYKTDKKSKQIYRFPVAAGKIKKGTAAFFSLSTIFFSIFLSYVFLNNFSFYLVLFANFMIISYSSPPIRIKERAFLGIFWNGIGYGWVPYYLALFISNQPITYFQHLLGLIPFLISASGHILLQVRDIKDDKKGSVVTTSTKFGAKKMKKVSGLMVLFSGLVMVYLILQNFLNYLAFFSIIFGILVGLEHKRMKSDVTKSYRKLQILYIIGGLFFILSIIKF